MIAENVNLIGQSPEFIAMLAQVSALAPLNRPVLILGERGTGKELVAHRLNFLSTRWNKPFLTLNCGALAQTVLDSELFGHEAGAFTGAARRRLSRFELADGGTIFLDEIGNASAAVQEKLLRVIEYGVFERVGGNDPVRVDVRILAGTNADLRAGDFRADLLDRLAFDVVRVPPLRRRQSDILHLAQHFATRMTAELGREVFAGFSPAAEAALLAHDWPGNVRELRNVVERSLYRLSDAKKPVTELVLNPFGDAAAAAAPEPAGSFREKVDAYEARLLAEAMAAARFNQRQAAERLGLGYHQLRNALKKHGMLNKG